MTRGVILHIGSGSLVFDIALRWLLYLEIICLMMECLSRISYLHILSSHPGCESQHCSI